MFRKNQKKPKNQSLLNLEKKINQVVGEFGNEWGKFIENLVTPNTVRLLKERGIQVHQTMLRVKHSDRWEIDSVVVNGQEVIALEVKKHLRKKRHTKIYEESNFI